MKVLALWSGQLRETVWQDIQPIVSQLDFADHKFTTWNDSNDFDFEVHDFINCAFNQPKMHYYHSSEKNYLKDCVSKLREIKHDGKYPADLLTSEQYIEHQNILSYLLAGGRDICHQRVMQHLAHAAAYQEFAKYSDYDVIIKLRYDIRRTSNLIFDVHSNHVYNLEELCQIVHETKRPIGIGSCHSNSSFYGHLNDEGSYLIPFKTTQDGMFGDYVIIHHREKFQFTKVFELFRNKQLNGAEGGWHQIMKSDLDVMYQVNNYFEVNWKKRKNRKTYWKEFRQRNNL
jgi:hypothetical protein